MKAVASPRNNPSQRQIVEEMAGKTLKEVPSVQRSTLTGSDLCTSLTGPKLTTHRRLQLHKSRSKIFWSYHHLVEGRKARLGLVMRSRSLTAAHKVKGGVTFTPFTPERVFDCVARGGRERSVRREGSPIFLDRGRQNKLTTIALARIKQRSTGCHKNNQEE